MKKQQHANRQSAGRLDCPREEYVFDSPPNGVIMPGVHTFYDGSTMLAPLASFVGVDTDKVNMVTCLFLSAPLGYLYQTKLAAGQVSHQLRTVFPLVIGLTFCYFCFGGAIKHLLANVLINYALMYFVPPNLVHKCVFLFATGYLTFIHYYRWRLLNEYSIDVTGPMMIIVQKVTMLAFSLHDGKARKKEDLQPHQIREALSEVPPLLMYLSYCFHFQTILTGPMSMYVDYVNFINGNHIQRDRTGKIPSPTAVAVRKLCFALFLLVLIGLFAGSFYPERIAEKTDLNKPFYLWLSIWWICIFFSRIQYYFAWVMADALCNISGFGFSGYDDAGNPEWKLMTNVEPLRVELAQSLKVTLDNWNITTVAWLRRTAYDRAPKRYRMVATYALSAWWHGFFPGYYIAFATAALFTVAGKTFRRSLRHLFLENKTHKFAYDVFSFAVTKVALAYATYSFVTMHFNPAVFVYSRVWFFGHIIGLLTIFVTPMLFPPLKKTDETPREKKAKEN